ncbi:MAG: diguanylate cyclase (GGDEF)-like protein [Gammaproteobacteria bacterium]
MFLHRKLSVILSLIVVFTIVCIYFSSAFVIDIYLKSNKDQYQRGLISSISNDINTFEIILETVERSWDEELQAALPILAARIAKIPKRDSQQLQAAIDTFKDEFNLSDVYLISSDLTVVAATLQDEVGLDMTSFSQEYTSMLRALLNQGEVLTHRVSHATRTGILKKYGYLSLPGSNLIVNADINVKQRLESESNTQLSRFLFGDYVKNLEVKYNIIKSIDLVLVSQQDAFSLFFEDRKIDTKTANQFYFGEPSEQTDDSIFLIPIVLESYEALGLKTILKIEFDQSPIEKVQNDLIIQLTTIAVVVILLAYLLLQFFIRKFVLERFIDLLAQINNKQGGDENQIIVRGKDEIAQVAKAVNTLMLSFEQQLSQNKVLLAISNTDSLTELSNRRHFDEKMEVEWSQATRNQSTFSIVMIDIDRFKLFNDAYGHEEGDKCLKLVAQCIKQQLKRPRDFVARYGGEEFMCLLPDTDEAGAIIAANNICDGIRKLHITHGASNVPEYITASLGCLTVNGLHSFNIKQLLSQVDILLYEAKNTGRNKICFNYIPATAVMLKEIK